jgi:predicted kinase
MPRLVLINGAPSSGKSTLAKRYVEDHPLTLALDIDVVRAMQGRWLDEPVEAGILAFSWRVSGSTSKVSDRPG